MSTICKLDPDTRLNRRMRHDLLRTFNSRSIEGRAVLAELELIRRSPRLTGATKNKLFIRGVRQLERIK